MSRHQAQPSHCRQCRDIKFMSRHRFCCPHRCPCRDLAMMSRHQACSTPFLLRRDAMSRPPLLPPMSRHQLQPAATQPGRDVHSSWSRPHVQTHQVATSSPCCDLKQVLTCSEIFFFFSSSSLFFFFSATPLMQ